VPAALAIAMTDRVKAILAVNLPNGIVLATLRLVDVKTLAELGLVALSAAYTIWRWRRDISKGE
jgi:hypothetical protein